MKFYLTVIFFVVACSLEAQIPFTLSFPDLQGDTIQMNNYAGKKLLVAVVDATRPDAIQLKTIDSLYKASDSSFSVLLIPVDDFGEAADDTALATYLADSLGLPFAVAAISRAEKDNVDTTQSTSGDYTLPDEESQQPLLRWLTHTNDNTRFNQDIARGGRLYLLDESGSLFGLFEKETPPDFLNAALNAQHN